MGKKYRLSFFYKAILALLLVILFLSVVVVLFAYCKFESKYDNLFESFGQRKLQELKLELAGPIKNNDRKRIKQILNATVIGSPFIEIVCLKSQKGDLCNKQEYASIANHSKNNEILKLATGRAFFTRTVVAHNNDIIVGVSLRDADLFFLDFLRKIILLFLFGGFILILISIIFLNVFIKPIKMLRRAIDAISNGSYEQVKISKYIQNDEIGLLLESFNNMSKSLKFHSEEIEKQRTIILNLVKRLIIAQEDERRKIARDLHDQLSQTLVYIKLQLDILRRKIGLYDDVNKLSDLISSELSNIHSMCFNLRPTTLDTLGLVPTLKNFIENIRPTVSFDIHLDVSGCNFSKPNIDTSINVFRIVQEALMNAIKYAKPKNVFIKVINDCKHIRGYIKDDGVGFDMNTINSNIDRNFGIAIMKERCEILKGTCEIKSKIGGGTMISFEVPS